MPGPALGRVGNPRKEFHPHLRLDLRYGNDKLPQLRLLRGGARRQGFDPEGDGLQFVGRTLLNGFAHLDRLLAHGHLELVRRHDAILRKRTQRTVVRGVFLNPAVVFVIASGHDVKRVGGNRAARNRLLDIPPDLPEGTRLGGLRRNVGRPKGLHVDFQPLTGPLARHAEVPARPIAAAVTAGHQIGDPILVNVACRRRVDLRLLRFRSAGSAAHGSSERPEPSR